MSVDLRRVKAERIAKGYSQEDMAKMLGWKSRATYSKRETGKVSLGADELAKIASVLGFSNDELGIFFYNNRSQKRTILERDFPSNNQPFIYSGFVHTASIERR